MKPQFNSECKSFRIFKNAITKPGTLKAYTKGLDHFMRFHRLKDYDYVAGLDKDPLQELLEDWVIAQKTAGLKNLVTQVKKQMF